MTSLSTASEGGGLLPLLSPPQKSPTSQNDNSSQCQQENGRKKRTFDIAFLTGQSESCETDPESNNNNNHVTSIKRANPCRSSCSPSPVCSSSEIEFERNSPYNLSHNQQQEHKSRHDYSSDTSSIDVELDVDVMTNGSMSDDEDKCTIPISTPIPIRHPPIPQLNHTSLKQRPSQIHHHSRVLLSLSQSHYNNHQNHYKSKIYRQSGSSTNTTSASTGSVTNSTISSSLANNCGSTTKNRTPRSGYHPPSSDMNGKKRGKNAYPKNPPVKEEIRLESKRTIDINHSSDSLKIKENLQFSTLIPNSSGVSSSSSAQQNQGEIVHPTTSHHHQHFNNGLPNHHQFNQNAEFNEFILPPHLATTFALFPHISSKFPGFHHHLPPGLSHHHQIPMGQQHSSPNSANQQGQPHSGIHFSATKVEKAEATSTFHHHNSSQFNHSQKLIRHHFSDLYPGCGGGAGYSNLISIHPPQFSPNGMSNQLSPTGNSNPGAGSTLLPPSLTALTLPAQNVCAKCSIGFRMTSDLVYHMRSHHKRDTYDPLKKQREEKLKCPVCHETFRERHHLTRHMTAHQDRVDEAAAAAAAAAVTAVMNSNHNHGGESFGQISNVGGNGGSSSTKLLV